MSISKNFKENAKIFVSKQYRETKEIIPVLFGFAAFQLTTATLMDKAKATIDLITADNPVLGHLSSYPYFAITLPAAAIAGAVIGHKVYEASRNFLNPGAQHQTLNNG